jgi:hypothetical protein
MDLTSVLEYLKSNVTGRPKGEWFNRVAGEEGIYAEPKNEMLIGASSGSWRGPLLRVMEFLSKNKNASVHDFVRGAEVSKYEADTIMKLLKENKTLLHD